MSHSYYNSLQQYRSYVYNPASLDLQMEEYHTVRVMTIP